MKTKLEQALESGTIQFPRGLTGEERRAFIKEKLVDSVEKSRRKLFESWYNSLPWPMCEKCSKDEHIAWQGFNAALDLLVIELPQMIGLNESFQGTPISEIRAQNHYNEAVTQCRRSIISTNLGIKIK